MNTKKFLIVFSAFTFSLTLFSGFMDGDKDKRLNKTVTNDDYKFISVNNILMWISNNGDGSHDPRTDGNGFYWPAVTGKSAIFEDGLIFGAKVNGEIRVNGNTHRQGLQAGKIINGLPDNPHLEKYRIYKIIKDWELLPLGEERRAREKDYNEWPIEDGAPYEDVNGDGKPTPGIDKPKFLGDETLWYVANDMDTARSTFTYGTLPLGLEFQTTVFGFDRFNVLGDVVFKKHRIINKGENNLHEMYLGLWSDPDLGDANDDYVGCDSLLNTSFCWNGDNNDGVYGSPPPSAGYTILQGPVIPSYQQDSALFLDTWKKGYKNLNVSSFMLYIGGATHPYKDPQQGTSSGAIEFYNNLRGLVWDGSNIVSPLTSLPTKFALSGDPETGTGWYEGEGWPGGPYMGDRRMLLSVGPFNMAPRDTQEIVFTISITKGINNKNSVTVLKDLSKTISDEYLSSRIFKNTTPPSPEVHSSTDDRKIVLWWGTECEMYEYKDPLITPKLNFYLGQEEFQIPAADSLYRFEGYRIWQFKDSLGADPVLIEVSDVANGTKNIRDIFHEHFNLDQVAYVSAYDSGLIRTSLIDKDYDTGNPLNNGSSYYYGVTAYAYSKFSDPPVLESKPKIVEVIPGIPPVDYQNPNPMLSQINFTHFAGAADAEVYARIIDPSELKDNMYEVTFSPNGEEYSLINLTRGDTLINRSNVFGHSEKDKIITDGFILNVINSGDSGSLKTPVRDVREIKGPGGININPVNVFSNSSDTNLNSTGKWTLTAVNEKQEPTQLISYFSYSGHLGFNNYEIRFTPEGSEYYSSGYFTIGPLQKASDPKAKGKLPFEAWLIPADPAKQPSRLIIKIFDNAPRDTSWSYRNGQFESIYTILPPNGYPSILPPTSGPETGSNTLTNFRIGNIVIKGELPEPGTVIQFRTWKPLTDQDKFTIEMKTPSLSNELAKQNINNISVFPNPYFAASEVSIDYPEYIRFTNLPQKAIIRIFSIAGVYITKIEKGEETQYIDWNLRNKDNQLVGSGIYLAYIELPGIGTRVMKVAVVR